jgi:hypothetical protein
VAALTDEHLDGLGNEPTHRKENNLQVLVYEHSRTYQDQQEAHQATINQESEPRRLEIRQKIIHCNF